MRGFWFRLEFGGWYSVNIPHLVISHASHQPSHVFPFQLRSLTAQPLYRFFQELELAAPTNRVMWAGGLRPVLVAVRLACFFWPHGNWIQQDAEGNLPAQTSLQSPLPPLAP